MTSKACTWEPNLSKLDLPNQNTITEWFSNDQSENLKKIFCSAQGYSSYSVYEVYNSKGAL